jgi:hypothetical protein
MQAGQRLIALPQRAFARHRRENMTTKKAAKVSVRKWSFERYRESVLAACKRAKVAVKGRMSFIQSCYDEQVTVRDAVSVVRDA